MKNQISAYPVAIEIPIAWGDMDAFQHVNNVVYFKYFESARIAYFDKIDLLDIMDKTRIGVIMASTECRYKIPLTYPDRVTVGAKVETIGEDRFIMKYAAISHKFKKVAAVGEGVLVAFDYGNNKKTQVPGTIRERIKALEASVNQNSLEAQFDFPATPGP